MKSQRKGRVDDVVTRAIKRAWDDTPVVDAKKDLRVFILPEDVACATRKDPGCCVFAKACIRSFSAKKVLFFRSIAYVELRDDNGVARVERFTMPKKMRDLIAAFDRGEDVIPKAGFLLRAPTPARQFERQRKKNIKRYQNRKLSGTARKGGGGNRSNPAEPLTLNMEVRSGTGSVHFSKNDKE